MSDEEGGARKLKRKLRKAEDVEDLDSDAPLPEPAHELREEGDAPRKLKRKLRKAEDTVEDLDDDDDAPLPSTEPAPKKRKKVNLDSFRDLEAEGSGKDSGSDESDYDADSFVAGADDLDDDDDAMPDETPEEREKRLKELRELEEDAERRREEGIGARAEMMRRMEEDAVRQAERDERVAAGEEVEEEVEQIGDGLLGKVAPTADDPKLWMVRTMRSGKEQELVLQVLGKVKSSTEKGEHCPIQSCFSYAQMKGFMYIEAYKASDITNYLYGIRGIGCFQCMLVPMSEMVQVFQGALIASRVAKVENTVKIGDYIRIKNNRYQDDLAWVREVTGDDPARQYLEVCVVPRLDLGSIKPSYTQKFNEVCDIRPQQTMFNAEDLRARGLNVKYKIDTDMYLYNDENFWKGFLCRVIPKNRCKFGVGVEPKVREMKEFQSLKGADMVVPKKQIVYCIGDTVIVVKGDTKGMKGKIAAMTEGKIDIHVKTPAGDLVLVVTQDEIQRYFEVADTVRIEDGAHKGRTGTVTRVDMARAIAHILVDGQQFEVRAPISFLAKARVADPGLLSVQLSVTQNLDLGDLVSMHTAMDRKKIMYAVVVHIESAGKSAAKALTILAENNTRVAASFRDVTKVKTSSGFTMDKDGQTVRVRDLVATFDGPNNKVEGEVKHIVGETVFIYSVGVPSNRGYRAVKRATLTFVAPSEQALKNMNPPTIFDCQNQRARKIPGYGKGGAKRNADNDKLLERTVRIAKGKFKGFIGLVIEEGDDIKVQLLAKPKVIACKKTDVAVTDMVEEPRDIFTFKNSLGETGGGWGGTHTTPNVTPSLIAARDPTNHASLGGSQASPLDSPRNTHTRGDRSSKMSARDAPPSRDDAVLPQWCARGARVCVKDSDGKDAVGHITAFFGASEINVQVNEDDEPFRVFVRDAKPSEIKIGDMVKVIGGPHDGAVGEFVSEDTVLGDRNITVRGGELKCVSLGTVVVALQA